MLGRKCSKIPSNKLYPSVILFFNQKIAKRIIFYFNFLSFLDFRCVTSHSFNCVTRLCVPLILKFSTSLPSSRWELIPAIFTCASVAMTTNLSRRVTSAANTPTAPKTSPRHLIFMAAVIFYFRWHSGDKFLSEDPRFFLSITTSICDEGVTAVSLINDPASCHIQCTQL